MRFHNRQDNAVSRPFTALIDVVFLLLVFFMLTLKIVEPEGELQASFDRSEPTVHVPPSLPLHVVLASSTNGELTDVRLAGRSLGAGNAGIERLRSEMRKLFAGTDSAKWDFEQAVTLRTDRDLQYQHIVAALSAVSGDVRVGGSQSRVVKYPVKVSFESAH